MKKKIYVLLLLVCLCLGYSKVNALDDTEPPVLNSVTLNSNSFKPGDSITVNVDASDNLTGIWTFDIEFRLKTDHSQYFTLARENPTNSTKYSYTAVVPENTIPGEYEAFAIQIWDGAYNLKSYYLGQTGEFNFLPIEIKIEDSGKDYTPPVLHNVSISSNSLKASEQFTLTAEITDDRSNIKEVTYLYIINGDLYHFEGKKTTGNTYVAKSHLKGNIVYSDALFVSLTIIDEANNISKYDYDFSRDKWRNYKEIKLETNLDVTYIDKIVDNQAPVLKNYSYSTNKVAAPGSVKINLEFEKEISGLSQVDIHFQGYANNKMIDSWILYADINEKKNTASFEFVFDQYTPNATFFVDRIVLGDKAGNQVTYSIYDDSNPNIEKKELTLTKAIQSDETTSTINNDYVDKIKKAKDNQIITIDTTKTNKIDKDVFDALRGTNKSVVLVNDGIQWVFNGKDIINSSKAINTKIDIYKIDKYGNEDYNDYFDKKTNAIVINFANNGLLPGKTLIKIKADYTFRDYIGLKNLFVYHVIESENGLETIAQEIDMTEDGYYEFYINHNSKYIISKKTAKKVSIVKDSTQKLGNESTTKEEIKNEDTTVNEEVTEDTQEEKVEIEQETNYVEQNDKNTEKGFFQTYFPIITSITICLIVMTILIIFRKKIFKKKKIK